MRHRLTLKFKPANTGPQNRRKTVGGILRTLAKPAKGQFYNTVYVNESLLPDAE